MIKAYAKTDVGRVREINEDSFYITEDSLNSVQLFILADGMGGCNAGDVAKKVFKYSKTAFYATCPLLNFKSQIKSGLKALCPVYRDNKGDTFVNFARKYHDDLNGAFQCLVEG